MLKNTGTDTICEGLRALFPKAGATAPVAVHPQLAEVPLPGLHLRQLNLPEVKYPKPCSARLYGMACDAGCKVYTWVAMGGDSPRWGEIP